MVERPISIGEVRGSIPRFSRIYIFVFFHLLWERPTRPQAYHPQPTPGVDCFHLFPPWNDFFSCFVFQINHSSLARFYYFNLDLSLRSLFGLLVVCLFYKIKRKEAHTGKNRGKIATESLWNRIVLLLLVFKTPRNCTCGVAFRLWASTKSKPPHHQQPTRQINRSANQIHSLHQPTLA